MLMVVLDMGLDLKFSGFSLIYAEHSRNPVLLAKRATGERAT
jgi:hypothetical protein